MSSPHYITGTIPAGLTSAGVRHLNHEKNVPEFNLLGAGIERMGELHKALSTIRATSDSRQTPEARAFKYKTVRDQALAKVGLINAQARKALDDRRERLRTEAFKKSGLLETYPQAQEVRQVLRGLSQKERDAEINAAIDRGDVWGDCGRPELSAAADRQVRHADGAHRKSDHLEGRAGARRGA